MKYIMVLLMSVGICTFTLAQDYNMDNDNSASDAKAPKEQMDNSSLYQPGMDNQSDNSMNSQSDNSMNNSSSNSQLNKEVSTTVTTPETTTSEVTTVEKKNEGESVAGVLWRSPFRIVGYTVEGVGKGVGSVAKGGARIVVAPFRAIGKAFRGHRGETEVVETTTASTVQPGTTIESNSSVEMEKDKSREYHENM